jgi:hypothetical protein
MERYHEPLTRYVNGYRHDLDAAEDLGDLVVEQRQGLLLVETGNDDG